VIRKGLRADADIGADVGDGVGHELGDDELATRGSRHVAVLATAQGGCTTTPDTEAAAFAVD
jgi:hypothetical protein